MPGTISLVGTPSRPPYKGTENPGHGQIIYLTIRALLITNGKVINMLILLSHCHGLN